MYYIYSTTEIATGFIFADLSDRAWDDRPGFKLTDITPFENHADAIGCLRVHRKQCKKYNLSVDPNYLPPSRRG